MKTKILLAAVIFITLSISFAVFGVCYPVDDYDLHARHVEGTCFKLSFIFVLGSIGLFAVGTVTPEKRDLK